MKTLLESCQHRQHPAPVARAWFSPPLDFWGQAQGGAANCRRRALSEPAIGGGDAQAVATSSATESPEPAPGLECGDGGDTDQGSWLIGGNRVHQIKIFAGHFGAEIRRFWGPCAVGELETQASGEGISKCLLILVDKRGRSAS